MRGQRGGYDGVMAQPDIKLRSPHILLMKYTQPTFSVPTGNGRISQTEYEIRVGLRCPRCETLLTPDGHVCGVHLDCSVPVLDMTFGKAVEVDTVTPHAVATITHYADRYPAEKNRAAAKFLRNIDPSPRKGF